MFRFSLPRRRPVLQWADDSVFQVLRHIDFSLRSVDQETRNKQSWRNMPYAIIGRQLLRQPGDHAASRLLRVGWDSTERPATVPDLPDSAFEAAAGRHNSIDDEDYLTADHRRHGGAGGCSSLCIASRRPAGQSSAL
jgi:hypothetical protein